MNRIDELFERKQTGILNVYCTAGFPNADSTIPVMEALQKNGADMIELGVPYSDPLADGPVIQESGSRSLAQGMTIKKLFSDIGQMRDRISIPVILMGYMNPVLQFGFGKFCEQAARAGVDGLILPDLPMFEYEKEYRSVIEANGLKFIFLVTPETSDERLRRLDALSSGFLYAVSSSSTTGNLKKMDHLTAYFEKLQQMKFKNPVLIGFGIRDKLTFDEACKYANGAIIGTAYINAIDNTPDIQQSTKKFIDGILGK